MQMIKIMYLLAIVTLMSFVSNGQNNEAIFNGQKYLLEENEYFIKNGNKKVR